MKVKEASGSKCYVLTLNRSDSAPPQAVLNASAPVWDKVFSFYRCFCRSYRSA